jgi:uncharacterized phage-associated protein
MSADMKVQAVIELILERCDQERFLPPLKTRLVKLIYLSEVEYFRRTGQRLTSLKWKFYHYGPYAPALSPLLGNPDVDALPTVISELLARSPIARAPSADHQIEKAVCDVVHDWGNADLNTLLDYVYFDTEPMLGARRGEWLDFSVIDRSQPSSPISVVLDKKTVAALRKRLSQRAAVYGNLRQAATTPEDFFANVREWDSSSSVQLASGECFIDPKLLTNDE